MIYRLSWQAAPRATDTKVSLVCQPDTKVSLVCQPDTKMPLVCQPGYFFP